MRADMTINNRSTERDTSFCLGFSLGDTRDNTMSALPCPIYSPVMCRLSTRCRARITVARFGLYNIVIIFLCVFYDCYHQEYDGDGAYDE